MGGRGASSGGNSEKSFIKDLVEHYDDFTRGDLQAIVQARAVDNVGDARDILAVGKEESRMLKIIDDEYDKMEAEKVKVAKQIAKKQGFSEANYKRFLQKTYTNGYEREEGESYTLAELKRQLKNLK